MEIEPEDFDKNESGARRSYGESLAAVPNSYSLND